MASSRLVILPSAPETGITIPSKAFIAYAESNHCKPTTLSQSQGKGNDERVEADTHLVERDDLVVVVESVDQEVLLLELLAGLELAGRVELSKEEAGAKISDGER